jgi:DNA-binding beta-propeller fold protein YncE
MSTIAGSAGVSGSSDGSGISARFYSPHGMATDDSGNLYVADTFNDTIRKIELASGMVSTIAGSAGSSGSANGIGAAALFNSPNGVTVDGAGNLYVAELWNHTIRKIVLTTMNVTTLVGVAGQSGVEPGPLPARLNQPTSVVALPTGELIIVDGAESVVLSVR